MVYQKRIKTRGFDISINPTRNGSYDIRHYFNNKLFNREVDYFHDMKEAESYARYRTKVFKGLE